jgi:hypothetical protein
MPRRRVPLLIGGAILAIGLLILAGVAAVGLTSRRSSPPATTVARTRATPPAASPSSASAPAVATPSPTPPPVVATGPGGLGFTRAEWESTYGAAAGPEVMHDVFKYEYGDRTLYVSYREDVVRRIERHFTLLGTGQPQSLTDARADAAPFLPVDTKRLQTYDRGESTRRPKRIVDLLSSAALEGGLPPGLLSAERLSVKGRPVSHFTVFRLDDADRVTSWRMEIGASLP